MASAFPLYYRPSSSHSRPTNLKPDIPAFHNSRSESLPRSLKMRDEKFVSPVASDGGSLIIGLRPRIRIIDISPKRSPEGLMGKTGTEVALPPVPPVVPETSLHSSCAAASYTPLCATSKLLIPKGLKVLLVDDIFCNIAIFKRQLNGRLSDPQIASGNVPPNKVLCANSAFAAIEEFSKALDEGKPVNAVVMDHEMSGTGDGRNGQQAIDEIRSIEMEWAKSHPDYIPAAIYGHSATLVQPWVGTNGTIEGKGCSEIETLSQLKMFLNRDFPDHVDDGKK